ncbi:putative thioredoxin [Candidatus Nanopelagicus abundans]|uniref:Putative thioredoxin n=1 Tax=Candidatus Nanopelagicus abundans TaxID=1884916 RepID=A0A249L598_9ACTN|nr:tetratricopeptide repeat protein [Candidatus Nanopelagicus abundans]ASY24156.1 putative thioredoxin [Candidatus Nanopelagicus abundans]
MSFNKPMPGGANFGNAFDLSSLKKPTADQLPTVGIPVTQENLVSGFVSKSKEKVVVLLAWSTRSTQSKEILETLGKLMAADKDTWILGTVDVDSQPQVAQALQIKSVPVAIAIIAEQLLPLFESVPSADQVRLVINKLLELAAQKGVGSAPNGPTEIPMEAEEEAAYAAMEKGDYKVAKNSYEAWLKRKPNEAVAIVGLAQVNLMLRIDGLDPVLTLKNAKDDDLNSQLMCADIQVASGDLSGAFDRLLVVIKLKKGDEADKAKAHLIALFNLVDPTDPRLVKARSELASVLF